MNRDVTRLMEHMRKEDGYASVMQSLERLVASHPELCDADDYREQLLALVRSSRCQRRLQNLVQQTVLSRPDLLYPPGYPLEAIQEPLDYMRRAQRAWERRLYKSLNAMSAELGMPLARLRPPAQQQKMVERPEEASQDEPVELERFRPVYAPKDFLEVLTRVENPNYAASSSDFLYGMVRLPLPVPDLAELQQQFEELGSSRLQHLSMSADLPAAGKPHLSVGQYREMLGARLLELDDAPAAREFAKLGVPQSQRGELWCQMLGVRPDARHTAKLEELNRAVLQHQLLADRLVARDVQLTAGNDDQYFVFSELLRATLLRFLRHTAPLEALTPLPGRPARATAAGAPDTPLAYPPCGVVPFHGFSMYLAPLCFVLSEPTRLLMAFERLYSRYFVLLHTLSSRPDGIVSLSLLLERLLREHELTLWLHCRRCRVQPLRLVFRWLVRAFSGYLRVSQLLSLWELVLAYDSLRPLALLAAAVLAYRRASLLAATSQQTMEAVLADLSSIRVLPLLRAVLGRWTA
ncbi:TBC1 domain family member 19 [Amphibalanus amphitrite]|uniref:TBC1 domain family member 19 n=1 Tax=Amphibalanus amphitrite TaxID=1232801 RepID=A0A6A4X906_AMPAM|nr:TBC1 domain family member 19 [Amphibalanus amphitrite]